MSRLMFRWMRGAVLALAVVLIAGCNSQRPAVSFELTDVTGAPFARTFTLIDQNGRTRSLADFKNQVVAVFFGYTHCPDVCPTTMQQLALVKQGLGADAGRLQVVFITVDPERDTQALLSRYVPAFDPSFLGLRGDAGATAQVAKEFKVFYQKQPLPGGDYAMDHTAGTYFFDPAGRVRLFAQYGTTPTSILHDVRLLLAGN
jgi:protein SCO1/2